VVDHVRDFEVAVEVGRNIGLEASQRKCYQFVGGTYFVIDGDELNAVRYQRIEQKIGPSQCDHRVERQA
jgi:hypothetical protein